MNIPSKCLLLINLINFRKHYILDALCCDTKQDSVFSAVAEKALVDEEQLIGAVAAVPAVDTSSASNGKFD